MTRPGIFPRAFPGLILSRPQAAMVVSTSCLARVALSLNKAPQTTYASFAMQPMLPTSGAVNEPPRCPPGVHTHTHVRKTSADTIGISHTVPRGPTAHSCARAPAPRVDPGMSARACALCCTRVFTVCTQLPSCAPERDAFTSHASARWPTLRALAHAGNRRPYHVSRLAPIGAGGPLGCILYSIVGN